MTEPNYSPSLLDATREALVQVGIIRPADSPLDDDYLVDADLIESMGVARRLVELGRGARSEAQVKTRQPLRRILVPGASFAKLGAELVAEIANELNVGAVESFASAGDVVDYTAKGNFRALGKRFGKDTPKVAAAIAAIRADPEYVGQIGTTCVPTLVKGGHAENALPQRATAMK